MRKIIAGIMAFCMSGSIFPVYNSNISGYSLTANAEETITEGELTFTVYDNYAEVTGCSKSAKGEIIIPESVNGLPVTAIAYGAFAENENITSVIIPEGVVYIWEKAFYGCTSLESVIIPKSAEQISWEAFYGCTSLESVTIPENVQEIIGCAFEGTPWLENKRKENPLVIVNNVLIDGRKCVGDIIIPDGVEKITAFAFSDCNAITSVVIPDSVTEIWADAFDNCTALETVKIGKGIEYITAAAFFNTPSTIDITILNPDCNFPKLGIKREISDSELSEKYWKPQGTIRSYSGSTAEEYVKSLPEAMWNFVSLGTAPEKSDIIYGDANLDGKVSISDSVMILQYVSNAEKYPLSNQAMLNADVYGNDGVTARDAFSIEKYDAGILTSLPEKEQL